MEGVGGRLGRGGALVRARKTPDRFGDVYLAHRDEVLAYFARRCLDPEHAWDLTAETFADMFANLNTFNGTNEIAARAWIFTIAHRKYVDWIRTGEVERRYLERLALPVPSLGPEEYERIEQLADLKRSRPQLLEALARLPDSQRQVLVERCINGRGYDDIARELNMPAVALRNRVSRALRQLSRHLDRDDGSDDD
jgi:RNA polymerase sigma factor (sigma-70 family)